MATKSATLHFVVEGEWFTWFLRHLWIEGNEEKAIKTWVASFPHLSDREFITGIFLDVVAGRKKFEGDSDGPNGFDFKDDKQKYWSPTQGGKPSDQYPLVQSWEDVLERKGIELFLAELDLRDVRLNRTYAPTRKENGYRSDRWVCAATENGHENRARKKVADLLATISNLCAMTGLKYDPIEIPHEGTLLEDKSKKDVKWPSRKIKHNPSLENNKKFHAAVLAVLETSRAKFQKKYGVELVHYNYDDVALLCGVDDDTRFRGEPAEKEGPPSMVKDLAGGFKEPMSMAEGLDKAIKQALAEGDTERVAMLNGFKNNAMVSGLGVPSVIPGLDVNKYVDDLIKADSRTSIEPEDVGTMSWDSGYIAPDGKFYGCPDIQHREFSKDLAEKFNLLPKKNGPGWLKAKRGAPSSEPPDCEIIMDKAGWVRVSVRRFFWDREYCKITQEQFVTIKDFMNAKKMDKAVFNDPTKLVSFEDGIKGL